MIAPVWVEDAVVIAIHRRQLAEHGGSDGMRDRGLLESALFRPKNQSNPSIFDLAAAYGYGIAKNHPFIDGNKRNSLRCYANFSQTEWLRSQGINFGKIPGMDATGR